MGERGEAGGGGERAKRGRGIVSEDLAGATICSERAVPLDGAVGPASRGSAPLSKPAMQLAHWCLCLSGPCLDQFPHKAPKVAPGSCSLSASPLPPSSMFFLTC